MAPDKVNGVTTMIWLRADISMMPRSIGMSSLSGELVLMMEISDGWVSSSASVMPRAILSGVWLSTMLRTCTPAIAGS